MEENGEIDFRYYFNYYSSIVNTIKFNLYAFL